MLVALLIVNLADELMIVFLAWAAPRHQATVVRRRSLGRQNFIRDEYRHFAVQRGIDPIVDEWRSQSVICRPALQAGEVNAVQSPAIIAAVGRKDWMFAGSWRMIVP